MPYVMFKIEYCWHGWVKKDGVNTDPISLVAPVNLLQSSFNCIYTINAHDTFAVQFAFGIQPQAIEHILCLV